MGIDIAMLGAMKSALKARQRRGCEADDVEAAELGLPSQAVEAPRTDSSPLALMAKMKSQHALRSVEMCCGTCVRWKTCSILHRAGKVSPKLRACEAYQPAQQTKEK